MDKTEHQPHTHLFTVRMWLEELGDGKTEWRGKCMTWSVVKGGTFAIGRL